MRIRPTPFRTGFRDFVALVKPGIVASNVLTALGGFALAPWPADMGVAESVQRATRLVAGTALLIAGSCAINNWLDRDIDALMARTKNRPTADGRLGAFASIGSGLALVAMGTFLLWTDGIVPAALGLLGAFIYVFPYTLWTKRSSEASSFVGGIAGATPPLIGWSVVDPGLGGPALVLFAFLVAWQQAHVRALALRRRPDFAKASVPMPGLRAERVRKADDPVFSQSDELAASSRRGLLLWILVLFPFPILIGALLARAATLPFSLFGIVILGSWAAAGALSSRRGGRAKSGKWGSFMFFFSLLTLVLLFSGLLATKLFVGRV